MTTTKTGMRVSVKEENQPKKRIFWNFKTLFSDDIDLESFGKKKKKKKKEALNLEELEGALPDEVKIY